LSFIDNSQKKNIGLAHDSFTQFGGAERVFEVLHELFPESTVYTLVVDKKFKDHLVDWKIKTSLLQYLYPFLSSMQYLLFFIPFATFFLRPKEDVIISSSSSFIRNIRLKAGGLHINYCHTPARFLWLSEKYANQELPIYLKPFLPILNLYLKWMRGWDYRSAQRINYFIANSKEVQNRIKRFYGKDSIVIPSFVDTEFWHPTKPKGDYFLIAGRLHAHKNNELIVKIFNDLGLPLHVVGTGRQEEYLKSIAKKNITFLGRVSDEILRDEYSGAIGFVYPQLEDFGMMPLEAASCGTASLGLAQGGSLETIIPGITGELFEKAEYQIIIEYLKNWDLHKYSKDQLRNHAQLFSKDIFVSKLKSFIQTVI
jgi:glycosyltransferase involved in cell wall biosynthesis